MYNCATSSDSTSKTIIRVGAATSDRSRILCSVPIQTTTTLNIQLFPSSNGGNQQRPIITAGNSNTSVQVGSASPGASRASQSTQYESRSLHHCTSDTDFDAGSTVSGDKPTSHSSSNAVLVAADVHRSADVDKSSTPTSGAAVAAAVTTGTMTSSLVAVETTTSVIVPNDKQPANVVTVGQMDSINHVPVERSPRENTSTGNQTTAQLMNIGTSTSGLNNTSHLCETTTSTPSYEGVAPVTCQRDITADEDSKTDLLVKLANNTESAVYQPTRANVNPEKPLESNNGSGVICGGDEPDGYSEEEAEEEDMTSFDDVDYRKKYSTFRFIGWDMLSKLKAMTMKGCRRVIVLKNSDVLLIFKTSCATNKAGNDRRLLKLMADIAQNCAKRLQMLKHIAQPSLSAEHMDSLPLSDGRQTGQHLAEISQLLGEHVAITDIAYRFQPSEPNVYLGSYVQGKLECGPQYEIGLLGVVVVLTRKNKYAAVEAFAEQLCQHIANSCPSSLGAFEGDRFAGRVSQCRRRRRGKQSHPNEEQLLLQSFTFDPTIIVAEAARRCLVNIDDFLLLQ